MDNTRRQQNLKEQIELRIELLEKKIRGELADDVSIPISLTKLRLWQNEKYGVEKIGSPSSFVTTHQEHGQKVRKIQKLLGQIRAPKKPTTKPVSKKLSEVTQENLRLKSLLQSTANQYVQYSKELERLKESAVLNNAMETGLEKELEEVKAELAGSKEEIARLRKKLLKHEQGPSSKVAKVDFGREV